MPIFEYKCGDCGKVSEFLEKQGSRKKPVCPECGGGKMAKQFSTFAAVVKEQIAGGDKCGGCENHSCPYSGN